MLARRRTITLPAMSLAEALETTRIHRVAGRTGARPAPVPMRPCRAPHHTIAAVGRIGGGQVPRPGDGSRAHQGLRWLDEIPERRHVLEVLRQALEKHVLENNLPPVVDLAASAALATRVQTAKDSGRARAW